MLPQPWFDRLRRLQARRHDLGRDRRIQAPQGLDFCSNDYLGLRRDPRLNEAATLAGHRWGTGAGAARLLRGSCPLHEELERDLAAWKRSQACLLFSTGFQANASLIPALAKSGDAVFSDALNHASLVDGCRMAKAGGAPTYVFRHLNMQDLEDHLKAWRATASAESLALVVTDAVFSMDGDVTDLPSLLQICERFEALLLIDEAHATGLLGATGAGLAEYQGVHGRVPLVMGTLGKALGSFGAFVACGPEIREHLVNSARGFIFSTALPPHVLGAARAGVRLAQTERFRAERALAFATRLRKARGQPDSPSAIVPILIGEDDAAVQAAETIQAQGFDVRAVRPPTVPEGSARLRITTGAHQREEDVDALAHILEAIR